MLTVIVFDDEKLALKMLNIQLSKINRTIILGEYLDYKGLIEGIKIHKPNIVFLDVETPNKTGIEIAKEISKISFQTEIVFVTAHKKYAYEAYEVEAIDYLLKPVKRERLERVIDKISIKIEKEQKVLDSVKVYTMHKFYIKNFNGEIVKWRTKKVEELMAYLIHNKGKVLSSDLIIEALWKEEELEKAKKMLYTSMYYLRKDLENFNIDIVIDRKKYGILNNSVIDDGEKISRYMQEITEINKDSIDKYNKVFSMYNGSYMELNNYSWSNEKKLKIERKFIALSKYAISYYEKKSNYSMIIEIINKLIAIDEYNEALYIKYIKYCKKLNNKREVKKFYQMYVERMNELSEKIYPLESIK